MSTIQADATKPGRSPDRSALSAEMIAQFRVVLRELKCLGSQRLLRRGVSMAHLHVMSMLDRHGVMTMSGIADALDVSLSNATGLVDRMEERGLVERLRDDEDRRVVHVGLTEQGRAALAEIEVFQADTVTCVLDQLDDQQLERLAATLTDLRAAVARAAETEPELFAHGHHLHPQAGKPIPPAIRL